MERYGKYMVYTDEEVVERYFGPKGTPKRDAFERELEEDIRRTLARQEAERETEEARKKLFEDVEEPNAVMA